MCLSCGADAAGAPAPSELRWVATASPGSLLLALPVLGTEFLLCFPPPGGPNLSALGAQGCRAELLPEGGILTSEFALTWEDCGVRGGASAGRPPASTSPPWPPRASG